MVGVSGGSRGCSTCRKRKIGCDLKAPICGQCAVSGRPCSGPVTGFVFQHYGDGTNGTLVPVKLSSSSRSDDGREMPIKDKKRDRRRPSPGQMRVSRLPMSPSSESARLQLLLGTFMEHFVSMTSLPVAMKPFIKLIPKYVVSVDSMLNSASRAVVIGHQSRVSPDHYLETQSRELFVDALRSQSHAVSLLSKKGAAAINDDTVATALLLSLYEIFCFTSRDSWAALMKGALKLFELRGPKAFRSGMPAMMFQSTRLMLTIYSLASFQDTFMSKPEWMTVPFELMPEKPINQKLVDLMLVTAKLLAAVRTVLTQYDLRQPLYRQLLATVFFHLTDVGRKLDDWFVKFKKHVSGLDDDYVADSVLYVEGVYNSCDPHVSVEEWCRTHLFKPQLIYAAHQAADLVPMFNAVKALVYKFQMGTYACAQEFPIPGRELEVALPADEYFHYKYGELYLCCQRICQSVDYVTTSSPNAFSFIFPLKSSQILLADPIYRCWLWNWCDTMDRTFGIAIASLDMSVYGIDTGLAQSQEFFNSLPRCPYCGEVTRNTPKLSEAESIRHIFSTFKVKYPVNYDVITGLRVSCS